jgi:methionine-rich copper-binding protein CopC
MKPTLPRFGAALLALLLLGATGPRLTASPLFHFALVKSAPADKATVHAVPAVTLWFSEPPSEGTVSIRLTDAAGEAVATADPAQDPEDDKVFGVALPNALAPGGYTVSWRGMGGDGHVVRGEFAFTVAGH